MFSLEKEKPVKKIFHPFLPAFVYRMQSVWRAYLNFMDFVVKNVRQCGKIP